MDFNAILKPEKTNAISNAQRVSGEPSIPLSSVVHHLHKLGKTIQSFWIVLIMKILQNFWLTLVLNGWIFHNLTFVWSLCGVMVKVSDFTLQLHYYANFQTNTVEKSMNPLIVPAMG